MYLTKEISESEACASWKKSETASLFSEPKLLYELGLKSRFIGGYKNEDLLVVWPLIETDEGFNSPPSFAYYFGPYLVKNNQDEPPYKKYRNNYEVFNSLIEKVESIAPKINFSLSPEFLDLRPFQWWNYNKPKKNNFQIDLKYTARYSIKKGINESQIISSFRSDDKRKKIKDIQKKNLLKTKIGVFHDFDFYIELYINTIARSGGAISEKDLIFLKKLIKLSTIKTNRLVSPLLIELNADGFDTPLGFQLLLIGKKQSYALVQSTIDKGRELNGNVFLNFKSLCYASENKFLSFDFNGANSPNRADDKHAFGADAVRYFNLRLKKDDV